MSDPVLAHYDFVSFFRRGAVAELSTPDPLAGALPARGSLSVGLAVRSSDGTTDVTDTAATAVELYGPGDIVGIDPRHVIKTEPRNLTMNYEPNYLAGIEFDHPEFPWLFTPAGPAGDRVRPWLCLLVLADGEFNFPDQAPDPLPAVEVTSAAALPDLAESWAWAHVQVTGPLGSADIGGLQEADSHRVFSRLLSARRLRPLTRYTAVLVPAFDLGVFAGLGRTVSSAPGTQANPAWQPGGPVPITLPVYHRFEFRTEARGDFELLVRALQPRVIPREVGMRPMLVDRPGWGVRSAGPALGLGGALRSLQTHDTPWRDPERSEFREDISTLANRASAPLDDPVQDPVVVPPLYGRWHVARTTVDQARTGWFDSLNTDPRSRSIAGFGTRVVLDQRNPLMASAWQQVEGIDRANELIRRAQLAREAGKRVFSKHFEAADRSVALALTSPVHERILASPRTIAATLSETKLPVRTLAPPFRRVARPRGPIARRQDADSNLWPRLVERLAAGELSPVPPLHPPADMVSLDDLSDRLFPPWAPRWLRGLLSAGLWLLLLLVLLLAGLAVLGGLLLGVLPAALAVAAVIVAAGIAGAFALRDRFRRWRAGGVMRTPRLTPEAFGNVRPRPDFEVLDPGEPDQPAPHAPRTGPDSENAREFRAAAVDLARTLQAPGAPEPDLRTAPLGELRTTVLERLAPTLTVTARVRAQIELADGLATIVFDAESLEEIMAAPEFPQPMYEPLRDLSQELLLPGLEQVAPNTLGLLRENHAFIEAYMVGLNHEMARQLLWNGYPTDQRSSYFRQFWDVRTYVPTPTDPTDPAELRERLKDVPRVHRWPRTADLGGNRNRPGVDGLVLLVRGDLLRRYPNAIVYAAEAQWDASARRHVLGAAEKYPQYRGALRPDLTFFGFDLTPDDARGDQRDRTRPQGWFFVFQEQPSEPRFGFDMAAEPFSSPTVTSWNDLSWANFAANATTFDALEFASASQPLQNVWIDASPDSANVWGADSAQIAYIALQRPVRVAVHATQMLPPSA